MEYVAYTIVAVVALGILLYIAAAGCLFFLQEKLLFVPNRQLWRTPADSAMPHEEIFLKTQDGVRIHGWYMPRPEAKGTILFFHGNAGNISHPLETYALLWSWGFNVFAIDYRGYGNSGGKPSERGLYSDAEAAWEFLVQRKKIAPKSIIIFGRSLGSAVAAYLGSRNLPGGVILESGFVGLPEIASHLYPWFPASVLCRHRFPTLERVPKIQAPLLIGHSTEDDLIPFDHGEKLYDAAAEPKFFLVMKGDHRNCTTATGQLYEKALQSFLLEVAVGGFAPPRRT